MTIVEAEFDQRLRVLRDERNRRYHKRDPIPAGTTNLIVGCRTDPYQRPDPALITDLPVNPWPFESSDYSGSGRLHLIGVRISRAHDLLGQTMGREEQAGGLIMTSNLVEDRPDQAGHHVDKALVRGVAADHPGKAVDPLACGSNSPGGQRGRRRGRRELRIKGKANDLV